jgi:hypothetical protein
MRVRLRKSWISPHGKKFPIGSVVPLYITEAKKLIKEGIAYEYNGEYPTVKKEKIEFFKPK